MIAPRRRTAFLSDRSALLFCLTALGATIAYPTLRLIVSAARQWRWAAVAEGAGRSALINTVAMGFASVIAAGVLGTGLALAVSYYRFPGRGALTVLAYLPFALPPLVGTLSFYYLIGPDIGVVPRFIHLVPRLLHKLGSSNQLEPNGFAIFVVKWLEENLAGLSDFNLNGPATILIIHAYSYSVYFFTMVSAALQGLDTSRMEAARTLGATRWLAFRRVMVPALMPALAGASLLTFMNSGASFSAPLFFGNDFPYLSVQIYNERSQFHEAEALTLSVVLAAVSLLGVLIFRSRQRAGAGGSKGAPRPIRSRGGRWLAGALAWSYVALLLAPHANILFLSFADHRAWHDELLPTSFTLENYTSIFSDASAFQPIRNSAWMSLAAAIACFAVGLPAAYLIGRARPGSRWVNLLVMAPWALPGTVMAMNLITAFNDPWLPLYNTVWILPLAYFVRFIPMWTRTASASVASFDASLIEAARTLGAAPSYCFRRVIAPLMAPSLAAATALVFASCLGEFVATILLYTPSNLPIAIRINMEWRGSGVGSAFAYAMLLTLIVSATFALSQRFATRTN